MMNNFVRGGYGTGVGMMRPSAASWTAAGPYAGPIYLALSIITWVLIIAILVAILRWLWKKGEKER